MTGKQSKPWHPNRKQYRCSWGCETLTIIITIIIIIIIIIILRFVKRRTQSYRGAKGAVNQAA